MEAEETNSVQLGLLAKCLAACEHATFIQDLVRKSVLGCYVDRLQR
jgi:hypothetical protein